MLVLQDKTVLIVDDEPLIRELLTTHLENFLGAKTFSASNGVTAYAIFENQKVDLIISDVRMPGGDGLTFLKKLRPKSPRTPIFFLITAFSNFSVAEAKSSGANEVISKPFSLETLETTIAKYFSQLDTEK